MENIVHDSKELNGTASKHSKVGLIFAECFYFKLRKFGFYLNHICGLQA